MKDPFDTLPDDATASKRPQRRYDAAFAVTPEYRDSLPDMQNAGAADIAGAAVPILQVGISGFRLPLRYLSGSDEARTLDTHVTGTVSIGADRKGVNMSRIVRTFYEFKDRTFNLELLEDVLLRYKEEMHCTRARLHLGFAYPILQQALRSGLAGYQYYDVAFEGLIDDLNRFHKRIHFDFVYSSACPASSELAEHAREGRHTLAIPHSQRSKARVSVEVRPGSLLAIEELHALCLQALRTETQVMVRREDEQAFAELNGAFPKFVEDAARLLYEQLDNERRITDFRIACAHLESLHSHDAVAVINRGVPNGFEAEFEDFRSLVC